MPRMIDADALIADMKKRYCKDCERRKGVKGGKVRMLYEIGEAPCRACGTMDAMDEIDNASTIEVEPVRCGRWKKFRKFFFSCSMCGKVSGAQFPFCPYCGADMSDEVSE